MARYCAISSERLRWMRRDDRIRERNVWRYWRIERLALDLWLSLRAGDYAASDTARKLLASYGLKVAQYKDKLPWAAPVNIVVATLIESREYIDGEWDMTVEQRIAARHNPHVKYLSYPTPMWTKHRGRPIHHPSFVHSMESWTFENDTPEGNRRFAADHRRSAHVNAEAMAQYYEARAAVQEAEWCKVGTEA